MNGTNRACIVLANGQVFEGAALGASGTVIGETVFTTGMNGYIETLTDPSYFGQIVAQTFPLVGNYGIIPSDFESASCHVRGYIVRSACGEPSNFRAQGTLGAYLRAQGIIGLCGIDTRALTKVLREAGVMNGMIISGDGAEATEARAALADPAEREGLLERIRAYRIEHAVESVSCSASRIAEDAATVFAESARYRFVPVRDDGTKVNDPDLAMRGGRGKRVVLWDFGAKANIRRELLKRGLDVVTVGADKGAAHILSLAPDGIMLSNGPGDPADNPGIIEGIRTLIKSGIPIFGICLGHQLLALAAGARTVKLKYGHRGANQPVKHLGTGRVYISSQNHGYAVQDEGLPAGAQVSFVNTNDGTNEGLVYTRFPAFSVQFHPEACAGPLDTGFLFDDFVRLMNDHGYFKDFQPRTGRVDPMACFAEAARRTRRSRTG